MSSLSAWLYHELFVSLHALLKLSKRILLLHEILWLICLEQKLAYAIDAHYYTHHAMYHSTQHNLQGLFKWEQQVIDEFFPSHLGTLLLPGAGAGREVIALTAMGFTVDGIECHPRLVELGNHLLQERQIAARLHLAPRDDILAPAAIYDGIILGWGMYSHIQGQETRIALLKRIRALLPADAPLMLSFLAREETNRKYHTIIRYTNQLRKLLKKSPLEEGDRLQAVYVHYFTKQQIEEELNAADFRLVRYSTEKYGHAVARAGLSHSSG